jgi:hypothetical protein
MKRSTLKASSTDQPSNDITFFYSAGKGTQYLMDELNPQPYYFFKALVDKDSTKDTNLEPTPLK